MRLFNRRKKKIPEEPDDNIRDSTNAIHSIGQSFYEELGIDRSKQPTSEVTYFTCLKMLSETLANTTRTRAKVPEKQKQQRNQNYYLKDRIHS